MKDMKKKVFTFAAAALMSCSAFGATIAHWSFDMASEISSGVISDVSGNGNTLYVQHKDGTPVERQAAFSTDTYATPYANGGSVRMYGSNADGLGSWYTTADNAPLNSIDYTNGYTVEVMFKITPEFTSENNAWAGILCRTGKQNGDAAANVAISNLGELQWQTQRLDGSESAVWSWDLQPTVFPEFHHGAFVNYFSEADSQWHIDMYVDGWLAYRNTAGEDFRGIMNYDSNPWVVGAHTWNGGLGGYYNGWIDDIRISDTALTPDQFTMVVPEPATISLMSLAGLYIGKRRRNK